MERYDEALKQREEELEIARELGNPQFEASFLHQLGMTLFVLNPPDEAFKRFIKSLAIKQEALIKYQEAYS